MLALEVLPSPVSGFAPGLDTHRRDYADFADPDGNTWTVRERGHHRKGN